MSEIDLDALEALANAATPGPWRTGHPLTLEIFAPWEVVVASRLPIVELTNDDEGKANAAFIAAARDALPALLDEVRNLREQAAHPPLFYQADADGSNLRPVEKALDPDSELIVVHEVRLLREQRDKVLAACDKSEAGCTGRCADARLPFCVCERELPAAIRAICGVSDPAQEQTEETRS